MKANALIHMFWGLVLLAALCIYQEREMEQLNLQVRGDIIRDNPEFLQNDPGDECQCADCKKGKSNVKKR